MVTCAIHQPNFFPWMGYFDKIKQADIFIFLDEVPYPKCGAGSWINRVKMMNAQTASWFGLPIKRDSGVQLIKDVNFDNQDFNVNKLLKTLQHNYKKRPFYLHLLPLVESLLKFPSKNVSEYNMNAIKSISTLLGLQTQFVRQSELSHSTHSTDLLLELVNQVNADTYLCGNGCSGYQQDTLFAEAGIKLVYQHQQPAKSFITTTEESENTLSVLHFLFSYYEQICH